MVEGEAQFFELDGFVNHKNSLKDLSVLLSIIPFEAGIALRD